MKKLRFEENLLMATEAVNGRSGKDADPAPGLSALLREASGAPQTIAALRSNFVLGIC